MEKINHPNQDWFNIQLLTITQDLIGHAPCVFIDCRHFTNLWSPTLQPVENGKVLQPLLFIDFKKFYTITHSELSKLFEEAILWDMI